MEDAVHSLLKAIDVGELLNEEIDDIESEAVDSKDVGMPFSRLIGR